MIEVKEIKDNSITEIIISKSKFFAYSFAVHNLAETKNFLEFLQKKYPDATHICYAFRLISGEEKACDDGEPQGTAGKPILDCIKKAGFQNVLVAVVRYFGGIKLGAGGLLRAYSNCASNVLSSSGEKTAFSCKKISFYLPISQSKLAEKIKNIECIKDIKISYQNQITLEIFVTENYVDKLQNQIKNILNQEINFEVFEDTFFV